MKGLGHKNLVYHSVTTHQLERGGDVQKTTVNLPSIDDQKCTLGYYELVLGQQWSHLP